MYLPEEEEEELGLDLLQAVVLGVEVEKITHLGTRTVLLEQGQKEMREVMGCTHTITHTQTRRREEEVEQVQLGPTRLVALQVEQEELV